MAIADEEVDAGADLLIPGDMGIGNTTPSAVLVAALLKANRSRVVGRGTGIDDATLDGQDGRDPRARCGAAGCTRPTRSAWSQTVGGADLAALAGLLVQAAVRRTPVVLDGVVICAARWSPSGSRPGARRGGSPGRVRPNRRSTWCWTPSA